MTHFGKSMVFKLRASLVKGKHVFFCPSCVVITMFELELGLFWKFVKATTTRLFNY